MGKRKVQRSAQFQKIIDRMNREAQKNSGPKNLNIVQKNRDRRVYGPQLAKYKNSFDAIMKKWKDFGESLPEFITKLENSGAKPSLIKILKNISTMVQETNTVMSDYDGIIQGSYDIIDHYEEQSKEAREQNSLFYGDVIQWLSEITKAESQQ